MENAMVAAQKIGGLHGLHHHASHQLLQRRRRPPLERVLAQTDVRWLVVSIGRRHTYTTTYVCTSKSNYATEIELKSVRIS